MNDSDFLHKKVKSFIFDKFPLAKKQSIRDDDSILERGIVDSLAILDIVNFIEKDFEINSPEYKNYPSAMEGHYPASYSFENDPSFPYSEITAQGIPMITGQPPEGWIPHYCGQVGALRVIDEYLGHKKVVELRKHTGTYGRSYTGMVNNFPTSVTAGTIEFWLTNTTQFLPCRRKFIPLWRLCSLGSGPMPST